VDGVKFVVEDELADFIKDAEIAMVGDRVEIMGYRSC
jgi:hypothetical protein